MDDFEKRSEVERKEKEDKLKAKLNRKQTKKLKRCGGGFVVPFQ